MQEWVELAAQVLLRLDRDRSGALPGGGCELCVSLCHQSLSVGERASGCMLQHCQELSLERCVISKGHLFVCFLRTCWLQVVLSFPFFSTKGVFCSVEAEPTQWMILSPALRLN